jgi:hypothetical protein
MPITYSVSPDGHIIRAVAGGLVTPEEFVAYEIDHAIDKRIKSPVTELFEIRYNALKNITMDEMKKVLKRRKEIKKPHTAHRCAIIVSLYDTYGWDLMKFYEGMTILHSPDAVIVFGDPATASSWLGIEHQFHPE